MSPWGGEGRKHAESNAGSGYDKSDFINFNRCDEENISFQGVICSDARVGYYHVWTGTAYEKFDPNKHDEAEKRAKYFIDFYLIGEKSKAGLNEVGEMKILSEGPKFVEELGLFADSIEQVDFAGEKARALTSVVVSIYRKGKGKDAQWIFKAAPGEIDGDLAMAVAKAKDTMDNSNKTPEPTNVEPLGQAAVADDDDLPF